MVYTTYIYKILSQNMTSLISPTDVCILRLKCEYGARTCHVFACCAHCRVTFCPVTSLVECYEMVLAIFMSVPENVWDECFCTCSRY